MKNIVDNSIKYLLILFIIAIATFSILIPDIFWSISNFQSMASQIPVLGILTLAMAITILTGGINLSIIATMNACTLIIAYFSTQFYDNSYIILGL
ncbi:TPA: ABC transporter permease, partial [Pasteurella multocida]|nr:ABC transporter permease [Pasteurella multocida]